MGKFITLGVLGSFAALIISSYITNANYGNRAENTIKAEYTNMENILGQYSLKVMEAADVPDMYADDVKDIVSTAIEGRYGETGSKAMMQWLQEQNPTVDVAVYKQLQQIIEAGRDEFKNSQTKFIDTKRVYETNLGYLWKGFWLKLAGYPKIDLDEYTIISSEHAVDAFKTKVDKGIKFNKD